MLRAVTVSAAFGLVLVVPAATAATAVVDSFDAVDMFASSTTIGVADVQGPAATSPLARTLSHTLVSGSNPYQFSYATVGPNSTDIPGTLEISNPAGVVADVSVFWTLPAAFIPDAAQASASLRFDLLGADLNTTARLFYNGVQISAPQTFAATSVPTPISFLLSSAEQNAISAGSNQVLRLDISGPAGYDAVFGAVGFQLDPPGGLVVTSVPEPATATMALGGLLLLAGLRARRRR
jgi:uncharacterized protein (TIGR03382 family)